MAATPTPAAQALLGALADRPGATATELAQAAGIGRSTATKLLAALASQGRVGRQPGEPQDGRRTADRWTLPTPAPAQNPGPPPTPATRHPHPHRGG
jgi:predicted ArsR family transcriptional regulator